MLYESYAIDGVISAGTISSNTIQAVSIISNSYFGSYSTEGIRIIGDDIILGANPSQATGAKFSNYKLHASLNGGQIFGVSDFLTDADFEIQSQNVWDTADNVGKVLRADNDNIFFGFTKGTPIESMISALEGKTIIYVCNEEITDISEYTIGDNFIETKNGGTVSFHQENDTKFFLPNEVNYMVKLIDTI